ncbi:MAG: hypothetical protein M1814_003363 [Vezdaea aestivalis]|nr:MAG: hypothetical protein M1814_003363 [Vezdaea aestivalis]
MTIHPKVIRIKVETIGSDAAPPTIPQVRIRRPTLSAFPLGRDGYSLCQYLSQRNNAPTNYGVTKDGITSDLTTERPHWILSSYGPGRDAPVQLFGGFPREQSFEEVRMAYHAGNHQEAMAAEQQLINDAQRQIETVLNDVDGAVKYVLDGERKHPNRHDVCNPKEKSKAGFGKPSQARPTFGNTPQPPSNPNSFGQPSFGQKSTLGKPFSQPKPSPFEATTAPSAFGQPSQPVQQSGFGQQSQPAFSQPQTSSFGQPTPLGFGQQLKPTFGQPSQSGFGQPAQPVFGQVGLGQTTQPTTSAFGQTVQPNPTPFGQPAQQTQPAFGQQIQPAFGQQQQPKPPFGQKPTPAFGEQKNGIFGTKSQPTQPTATQSQPVSQPLQNPKPTVQAPDPSWMPAFGKAKWMTDLQNSAPQLETPIPPEMFPNWKTDGLEDDRVLPPGVVEDPELIKAWQYLKNHNEFENGVMPFFPPPSGFMNS